MKFIKKYAKTANAPKQLTTLFEKIKVQEQSLQDCKKELKDFKKSCKTDLVNFNETKKKLTALRRAQWRKSLAIRKTQRAISQFPVMPIIIPMPVDIN
jgi:DNA repair ATPase RecN